MRNSKTDKITKIMMITPTFSPDVGGVETMLDNLCNYLTSNKFKVDVITHSPLIVKAKAPNKEVLNEYVTVRRMPWVGFGLFNIFEHYPPIQFLYLVPGLFFRALLFLLRPGNRPNIIHAFGLSGAFVGGFLSRLFRIPCVVDMCTVYRFPKRPILAKFVRFLLNWSDYVRGNNPIGKQELIDIGIDPKKLGMITPPVDEQVFKPMSQEKARMKIGMQKNNYIALFAGRMVKSKGVEIAAQATKLVKNPNVDFVFIGEGPLRHLVEEAASEDKRIHIEDNVSHHDLVYYYNAADVLMCAPVDTELIAFVGREALMCGLPILAPNMAVYFGIPYEVDDLVPPKVGRFFEPSPNVLAGIIDDQIEQKDKGNFVFDKQSCRDFALENFSTKNMKWIDDAYQSAISIRSMN